MTLNKTHQACMPIINTSSIQIPNWSCLEVIFFLPPSYRQISSKWQTTLCHTLTSSKMHGTTCLWRCPALRRICFLWRLKYMTVVHQVFACLWETSELFVLRCSRSKWSFVFCPVGWRRCSESVGPHPDFLADRIQEFSGRQGKTDMKSWAEHTWS